MRILFVGGCVDGRWEELDGCLPYRRVIRRPKPMDFVEPEEPIMIETGEYKVMKIQASDVEYLIYIPCDMPPYEAFRLLINNYRPIV